MAGVGAMEVVSDSAAGVNDGDGDGESDSEGEGDREGDGVADGCGEDDPSSQFTTLVVGEVDFPRGPVAVPNVRL